MEIALKEAEQEKVRGATDERKRGGNGKQALTVADFLVRHVVPGGEAVFGHRHVGVEGEGQQAGGRLDLRRDLRPAVPANQGSHCRHTNQRFSTIFKRFLNIWSIYLLPPYYILSCSILGNFPIKSGTQCQKGRFSIVHAASVSVV